MLKLNAQIESSIECSSRTLHPMTPLSAHIECLHPLSVTSNAQIACPHRVLTSSAPTDSPPNAHMECSIERSHRTLHPMLHRMLHRIMYRHTFVATLKTRKISAQPLRPLSTLCLHFAPYRFMHRHVYSHVTCV